MIICNSHNFLYINIPYTADCKTVSYLSGICGFLDIDLTIEAKNNAEKGFLKFYRDQFSLDTHAPVRRVLKLLGEETFTNYYRLAVVRNPFARALDVYKTCLKNNDCQEIGSNDFYNFLQQYTSEDKKIMPGLRPQINYIHKPELFDSLIRVEILIEDLSVLSKNLGIKKSIELKSNKESIISKDNFVQNFSEATVDFITEFYTEDFKILGYSKDPQDVEMLSK